MARLRQVVHELGDHQKATGGGPEPGEQSVGEVVELI